MAVPDPSSAATMTLFAQENLLRLGRAAFLLLVAALLVPLARRSLVALVQPRLRPQQVMLLRRSLTWLGYGLVLSCALSQLGFDLGVLLGAAGVFTVAVGFAAQTSVANLISGLFLIFEQPFSVADSITVTGITGEVLSVDLLSVKLRTPDNLYVRLPNELLLKSPVTTLTRYDSVAAILEFGVAPGQPLAPVRQLLLAAAHNTPACATTPAPLFQIKGYDDAAVVLTLMVWAQRSRLVELKVELQSRVLAAFAEQGVALPRPQRHVVLEDSRQA